MTRPTSPFPETHDEYVRNVRASEVVKEFRRQVHGEIARLDAADRGEVIVPLGGCACYPGLGALRGTTTCMRTGVHAGGEHGPRAFTEPCTPEGDPEMTTTRADGRMVDHFMGELHAGAIDDEELALLEARVVEAIRRRDELSVGAWRTVPLAPATETTKTVNTDALPDPLDADAARARRDAMLANAWKENTR